MPAAYDQNDKAGNEGDICKHPALIAGLDRTIADADAPFRYADIFAGYATNPLKAEVSGRGASESLRESTCSRGMLTWLFGRHGQPFERRPGSGEPTLVQPGSLAKSAECGTDVLNSRCGRQKRNPSKISAPVFPTAAFSMSQPSRTSPRSAKRTLLSSTLRRTIIGRE